MSRSRLAVSLVSSLMTIAAAPLAAQRIDRASPSPVELVPGGLAVTVELIGSDLQLLSDPRVVLRGRPVRGLVVSLARAGRTGTTRRTAQLTAEAGLADMSGLELVLVSTTDGRALTVPVSISVATRGLSPDPRTPSRTSVPTAPPGSPTVISASPKEVVLTPGGSQTVMLWGTNLDNADLGRVMFNSSPVSGVRAEFLPSANPDQREIRLTATSSGPPPWNTVLDVEIGPRAGPFVRTPVELSIVVPDLAITAVEPYPDPPHVSDPGFQLRIDVENRGPVDVVLPAGMTIATVQGSGWQHSETLTSARTIRPDQHYSVSANLADTPAHAEGTHTLTLSIDPANAIREADEGNNQVTTSVTMEPGLYPDLTILGVATDPSPAVTGVPYGFVVTVRNIGNERAEAGFNQNQRILVGSRNCPLSVDDSAAGISPNQERQFTLSITDPGSDLLYLGAHSCTLYVELQRSPDENDTTNNEFTYNWSTVP